MGANGLQQSIQAPLRDSRIESGYNTVTKTPLGTRLALEYIPSSNVVKYLISTFI